MTQGMKLYCLRNRLDLSAHQVASIVGIDRSTLYRYERDEAPCRNPDVLRKLSRLYQVTENYLSEPDEAEVGTPGTSMVPLSEPELVGMYRKASLRDQLRISGILRDRTGEVSQSRKKA